MENLYTGGQLAVKLMEEFGVKVAFGIPGGQTLSVNNAMYDSTIRFVHTRHENGDAVAAYVYGRLTGEPGVCLATTGPGATNLITGLGGALRDSSPVIALVFQNKLPDAGRGDAQESDHELLFGSICKKYIPVRDISSPAWSMREAGPALLWWTSTATWWRTRRRPTFPWIPPIIAMPPTAWRCLPPFRLPPPRSKRRRSPACG